MRAIFIILFNNILYSNKQIIYYVGKGLKITVSLHSRPDSCGISALSAKKTMTFCNAIMETALQLVDLWKNNLEINPES